MSSHANHKVTESKDDDGIVGGGVLPLVQPRKRSYHEEEYYKLMDQFKIYTNRDVDFIPNTSHRILLKGLKAGSTNEVVMNGIALTHNDILPVRIANKIIIGHLKNLIEDYVAKRVEEESRIQKSCTTTSTLSLDTIDHARKAFMNAIAAVTMMDGNGSRHNHKETLSIKELIDSGLVGIIVDTMNLSSENHFTNRLMQKLKRRGKVSFEKFVSEIYYHYSIKYYCKQVDGNGLSSIQQKNSSSLGKLAHDNDDDDDDESHVDDAEEIIMDIESIMESISKKMEQRMEIISKNHENKIPLKEKKLREKYDLMRETVCEWEKQRQQSSSNEEMEDLSTAKIEKKDIHKTNSKKKKKSNNGRMDQILDGWIAGSKDEEIDNAIRIVYLDYTAARIGMDLLFGLMKKFVV